MIRYFYFLFLSRFFVDYFFFFFFYEFVHVLFGLLIVVIIVIVDIFFFLGVKDFGAKIIFGVILYTTFSEQIFCDKMLLVDKKSDVSIEPKLEFVTTYHLKFFVKKL